MSSDLRDQLQAALGPGYLVERELGGGGMSRVFVADELALGRKVVVKVLPWNLVDPVSAERFTREIMMAARLQQANIVPLLSTGRSEGQPYYTMPFVEGQSLRERLERAGSLSIAETVNILRDVARALAYAHDKGVVHRDIKPENVLLSGEAAVVSDFGIAKALAASVGQQGPPSEGGRDPRTGALTAMGTSMGTPQYMSPEQGSGDPTMDHRADIYSFGCMAFELLCGRTPFSGLSVHQLFRAHMTEIPPRVDTIRLDVPPGLARLVARCLEKDPGQRPQSAREMLKSLETSSAVTSPVRYTSQPVFRSGAVPMRGRKWLIVASLAAVVAVGTVVVVAAQHGLGGTQASQPLLAVLPFVDVGGDSASNYLAEGTSDELAIALGKIPGVRIAPRAAASHYRGRDVTPQSAGTGLGVPYVISGSVTHIGPDVKIAVHLSNTSDGSDVWSQSFVRVATDVFGVQDDVARATTEQIAALLSTNIPTVSTASRRTVQGTADAEAYDLYLRGQFLVQRRFVRQAREIFGRAIVRDSNFARAYAGLSEALAFYPQFTGTAATVVFDSATAAANHALALDSTLAQAHMSLGIVYMNAYDWEQASVHFRRAVALDPTDAAVRLQWGRFLVHTGRLREARIEIARAKQLDPFSGVIAAWSGYALYQAGKLKDAVADCRRAIELDSTNMVVLAISSFVNLGAKNSAVALRYADRQVDAPAFNGYTAYVHGVTGDRAKAEEIIHRLEARQPRPWFAETAIAMGYLGLRDTSNALAALERSTDAREAWTSYIPLCDPMYDPLRSSARFATLLGRVGLELRVFAPPPGGRCGGAS